MKISRNHLPTAIAATALVVAVAGTGGPVVAAAFDARNADKVDGKHAVSAGAKIGARKNKLVATGKTGYLPDNIIKKARAAANADKVGGLTAPQLQFPAVIPAGVTVTGRFEVGGYGNGSTSAIGSGSFPALLSGPEPTVTYLENADPRTTGCQGDFGNPIAEPGHLCIYEGGSSQNLTPSPGTYNIDEYGFGYVLTDDVAGSYGVRATWAVTPGS